MSEYKAFIFDLDGTMLDTTAGVFQTIWDIEDAEGLKRSPANLARKTIGPPGQIGFRYLYPDVTEEYIWKMLGKYYEVFQKNDRYKGACVYANIVEILKTLHQKGYKVCVATAKDEDATEKMLKYFKLYDLFDTVASAKGKINDKVNIVAEAIRTIGCKPAECVMVGDSIYDGNASKELGMGFIACLYGFGFEKEKDVSGYTSLSIVKSTEELLNYVNSL